MLIVAINISMMSAMTDIMKYPGTLVHYFEHMHEGSRVKLFWVRTGVTVCMKVVSDAIGTKKTEH